MLVLQTPTDNRQQTTETVTVPTVCVGGPVKLKRVIFRKWTSMVDTPRLPLRNPERTTGVISTTYYTERERCSTLH